MEKLVCAGSNVNAGDEDGNTALHCLAKTKFENEDAQLKCCQILLKAGSDVNARNTVGETALHSAAKRGASALLSLLLESSADVNLLNTKNQTPLQLAIEDKQAQAAAILSGQGPIL